jgi:O-antigen/teichoic acid export membrane protein
MSRTRNSAWNLAAGVSYALASAAASLMATPLLLRWLGAERLGAYRALTDWVWYLSYFELGFSGALMAAFAARIGQDDPAAVTRMLAAGLRAYGHVMLAQLAVGLVLVLALPYLIARTEVSESELRLAGAVALLLFVGTPLLVFRALAEARQRGYLNWSLLTMQVLLMNGLLLAAAHFGWGLMGLSAAFVAAQLPPLLVLTWDGLQGYRGAWRAVAEPAERAALWKLSWPTFIHGLTDKIGLVSDNLIIAGLLGSAAVVPFFLSLQLALFAQFLLRGFGNATWAGLADLHARGEADKFRARLLELTGIVSGLGLALLLPVATYNRFFVALWVGREIYAGEAVTRLACLNALLWAVYALWGWALLGTGHIRQWMPFAVLSTLVNVVLSVSGTVRFGVVGPLLGTTTGLLLITSWALPHTLQRAFAIPVWTLWRAALTPLRWSLLYAVMLWVLAIYAPPVGWLGFITMAGLAMIGGLALWWRFSLGREEREEWQARLKNILP